MGLFDGLSKFGMKKNIGDEIENDLFLTAKEKAQREMSALKNGGSELDGMTEEERLLEIEKSHLIRRNVTCKCCDKVFPTFTAKSGHAKRMEPDIDLRPRYENFDVLKYNIYHCPYCGYTSIIKMFPRLSDRNRKEVMEKICSQFKPEQPIDEKKQTFNYDEVIDYHKLALFTEVIKNGRISDKAYICLLLGWLYRGKREELERNAEKNAQEIEKCKEEEKECLLQAFEGFNRAFSKESAPYAGMDDLTTEYLLAALAMEIEKYDMASRFISSIITSRTAPSRIKDKARRLKEETIERMHLAVNERI